MSTYKTKHPKPPKGMMFDRTEILGGREQHIFIECEEDDTPETDALTPRHQFTQFVSADFARNLERERNKALELLERTLNSNGSWIVRTTKATNFLKRFQKLE